MATSEAHGDRLRRARRSAAAPQDRGREANERTLLVYSRGSGDGPRRPVYGARRRPWDAPCAGARWRAADARRRLSRYWSIRSSAATARSSQRGASHIAARTTSSGAGSLRAERSTSITGDYPTACCAVRCARARTLRPSRSVAELLPTGRLSWRVGAPRSAQYSIAAASMAASRSASLGKE